MLKTLKTFLVRKSQVSRQLRDEYLGKEASAEKAQEFILSYIHSNQENKFLPDTPNFIQNFFSVLNRKTFYDHYLIMWRIYIQPRFDESSFIYHLSSWRPYNSIVGKFKITAQRIETKRINALKSSLDIIQRSSNARFIPLKNFLEDFLQKIRTITPKAYALIHPFYSSTMMHENSKFVSKELVVQVLFLMIDEVLDQERGRDFLTLLRNEHWIFFRCITKFIIDLFVLESSFFVRLGYHSLEIQHLKELIMPYKLLQSYTQMSSLKFEPKKLKAYVIELFPCHEKKIVCKRIRFFLDGTLGMEKNQNFIAIFPLYTLHFESPLAMNKMDLLFSWIVMVNIKRVVTLFFYTNTLQENEIFMANELKDVIRTYFATSQVRYFKLKSVTLGLNFESANQLAAKTFFNLCDNIMSDKLKNAIFAWTPVIIP